MPAGHYYVYLLASDRNGTLYVGVTNDLVRRVSEHRQHLVPGFTKTYDVTRLVWFEVHQLIHEAIAREKRIKTWKRAWKIELFRENNPDWVDLFPEIAGA
jgi:putative endonuclease